MLFVVIGVSTFSILFCRRKLFKVIFGRRFEEELIVDVLPIVHKQLILSLFKRVGERERERERGREGKRGREGERGRDKERGSERVRE